jgi:hypothetical protein
MDTEQDSLVRPSVCAEAGQPTKKCPSVGVRARVGEARARVCVCVSECVRAGLCSAWVLLRRAWSGVVCCADAFSR